MTREGFAYDPERGELWYAGEAAEAVLLELEARRRALEAEIEELERRGRPSHVPPATSDPRPAEAAERLGGRSRRRSQDRCALRAEPRRPGRRARPAGERARRGAPRARGEGGRAATCRGRGRRARPRQSTSSWRRSPPRRRSSSGGSRRRAPSRPRETIPRSSAEKLVRLERRRESLGSVNPLAKEEYEREKERLDRAPRPARRPRAEPEGAREPARRADGDRRAPLRGDVRGRPATTSRRSRRRSSRAARAAYASPSPSSKARTRTPSRGSRSSCARPAST